MRHDDDDNDDDETMKVDDMASIPLTTIILDRFSTMQYFWFRIQHSFQWSQFISLNIFVRLVQLFIQCININCTFIAYGMIAAVASTTAVIKPIKLNANASNTVAIGSQSELFIKNDPINDNFKNIIVHDMNFDHTLFCKDAVNQQTITENKTN